MSDDAPLTIRRDGPVVRVAMDRPHRRNALSEAMGAAWDALLAELTGDATARVLVISGAGGHFCAGLDLTEVPSDEPMQARLARQQARNRRTGARFGDIAGQTAVFFVLVVAAAEVVVGLGIIVSILRRRPGATADDLAELKG